MMMMLFYPGKGHTTMAPIHQAKPRTLPIGAEQVTTKYPSASCLHDLLTMEEEELDKLYPTKEWLFSSPASPSKVHDELEMERTGPPSPSRGR